MRIGIDLGGTKTEVIALGDAGEELFRKRVTSAREYQGTLRVVTGLVREAEEVVGSTGSVGVGIPGTASSATGLIKNANSTWLIGEPLGEDLERLLERPVRLMNDANCFALSEASDGAGAGAEVVFGVILGTGVGGALVVGGRCHVGVNQIAGEWGHNPLPWPTDAELPGPVCYCGRRGCIETYLSGPGMERDHQAHTGQPLGSVDIVRAAAGGDAQAGATLDRYFDRLGRGLASVVNVLDPDVVVLGGGMSNVPGIEEAASASLARYVFSDTVETRIVRNMHGDSSGVRGAAWLWPA